MHKRIHFLPPPHIKMSIQEQNSLLNDIFLSKNLHFLQKILIFAP